MKLGQPPDESAILSAPAGGAITNTLRWAYAVISAGFNLEHDTETSRHSTIRAMGSISERLRTVAMGDWIDVPFGSVVFAGNAGAWTPTASDVMALRYTLIGHTLAFNFFIATTSVAAGSSTLLLPLPPGFKAAASAEVPFTYSDNGTLGTGIARISTGESSINLFTAAGANWTAAANNTLVSGQLLIEIQ